MQYLASDFYFLSSAAEQKSRTVGDAYEGMCTYMGYPVSMPCLLHAIRGLVAGGYITVEPDGGRVIAASTRLSVTPEGKKSVSVSPLQKLFGEYKAHLKNEKKFCDLERPDASDSDLSADRDSFDDCVTRLIRAGDISHPTFEIDGIEDGYLKLTVHHPNDGWSEADEDDGEEASDPDVASLAYSASVTCTEAQIKAALHDLIVTAHALVTEPARARKVALHGVDASLLISMANAANEQGLVSFRVTVSKIRFNRQRFVGKRDSDLDYAQCGDPLFIHEMSGAEGFAYFGVFQSVLARPDLLDGKEFALLSEIHHRTH